MTNISVINLKIYIVLYVASYCIFHFTGSCKQSINSTEYFVTYTMTPSYMQSTAALRCVKEYASIKPGSAVCGSDGEWIIEYPECEGMLYIPYSYIVKN